MDALKAALGDTIRRLRQEKEQKLARSKTIGYRAGHRWAMKCDDHSAVLAIADDAFGRGQVVRDAMWDLDRDLVASKEAEVADHLGFRHDASARESFWDGFVDGVAALWK